MVQSTTPPRPLGSFISVQADTRTFAVTVVAAVCLYIAIKIGSGIADIYPATNPGFYLLVYGAPLALTSAMLWLIGQALPSRVNDRATMAMNEANQGSNPVSARI